MFSSYKEKFQAKISFIAALSRSLEYLTRADKRGGNLELMTRLKSFLLVAVITMITMSRKCLSIVSRHFRGVSLPVVKERKRLVQLLTLNNFFHFLKKISY